ncbi:hypothetical protein GJ629_06045 [Halapricum sp. CBA1109]|uniref:hypothetical protein n=1 Tax=Halapricum sp. CBA1109 TaxID=2668068 RepID=UPI0012FA48FB|nr:hypothetical protein [Halapricum sp. CBA1109]MUV89510.1 hypothetical protein [Halapricum sp. CBA1109]
MASGIGEYATGIDARLRQYDWWKHHVLFFASLLVVLPMVLLSFHGLRGVYSILGIVSVARLAANLAMYVIIAIVVVTSIGALPGYYYDAKYLEREGFDYSPRWPLYTIVHVIPVFGPFIAVPLYVIQRWRHVGLPMQEFLPSG